MSVTLGAQCLLPTFEPVRVDAKTGKAGTVQCMHLHLLPPTRDIALVALASCVDLRGTTVRAGCDWLTRGVYKTATLETLAKLRLWMPLTALALLAAVAAGIGVTALVNPLLGSLMLLATLAAPVMATVTVRRKAAEAARAPKPDTDGLVF